MQLLIYNLTGSTRTYLSGAVSVPANSSTAVTSTIQQLALATDGALRSDVVGSLANVGDGTNTFGVSDALVYLYLIPQILGPLSDGLGNNITSLLVGSKQRLDVNSASEGSDGTIAPTWSIQVGGKDGNGNLQSLLTDTSGALNVTTRIPLSGSSPTSVSVGTSSTAVITANAARRGLVITNLSTGIVSFNVNGGTAAVKSGITLYPGGVWDMDEYTFTTSSITGISTVAASIVGVQEFT